MQIEQNWVQSRSYYSPFTPIVSVNAHIDAWKDIIDLYLHHSHRVYGDRDVSVEALKWVLDQFQSVNTRVNTDTDADDRCEQVLRTYSHRTKAEAKAKKESEKT